MSEQTPFRPEVVPGDRIFLSHPQREDVAALALFHRGSPGTR